LHLAIATIGIGPGDEVLLPSFSYVATANCVLYQGGKPVFVDIEPQTLTLDAADMEAKITPKTKAVIPVHFGGQCADMDPIRKVADRHGISVIEDATEAHGAIYKGKKAGSLGEMGCFSFTANKNMTTGEGGMVTTSRADLEERARRLRSHGESGKYHHLELGFSYRLTDFQAALGIAQLRKLPRVLARKTRLAHRYDGQLSRDLEGQVHPPVVAEGRTHTYMLYTVIFETGGARDRAVAVLERHGVDSRITFPPIHLQPLYVKKYGLARLPVTDRISTLVLSLPIFPKMTREMQDKVVAALKDSFVTTTR